MVYEAAASIFYAHHSFVRDVNQLRKKLTGRINVGAVDSTVTNPNMPLSAAIGRFHDKHGDVYISLHVQEPAQLERAILEGGMHLGIAPFYQHVPGLVYTPLFEERHQLYCAKGHPLFEKAPDDVELSSLLDSKYVLRSHVPSKIELPTDRAVDSASVSDMEAMAHLILSGRFIGFLPVHYARIWTEAGRLRPLLPAQLTHISRFEVATKRERKQERLIRAFLEELLSQPAAGQPAPARVDAAIPVAR
ncbi:substrate-binding domain-containing protein [Starkeya sp. ORNL1]|uniref:substrate-binding domain-containing protein n=1 Tax=Starkeya sp. ORNL1 TaxID=2709380 RepID=UPI001FEEC0FD|nr:substrate-binding domain-containing protein [Starkeya sp. ORNL1]